MPNPGGLPLVEPMLAAAARALPDDDARWTAEFKWDGMRGLAYIAGGTALLRSRTGRDVTASFPEVAAALAAGAGRRRLILDGELVALDEDGIRPSFALLQRRMHVTRPGRSLLAAVPVTFMAFDLLYQGRRPLTGLPYDRRRARLAALPIEGPAVAIPPGFPGEARAAADASGQLGLEGLVLKRRAGPYRPGRRSADWLKVKNLGGAGVLIGGWLPAGRRGPAAAILVGRPGPGGLRYLGRVSAGLTAADRRLLAALLGQIEQDDSPFDGGLPGDVARRARWARPALGADVAFTGLTSGGRLREPRWRGLRHA